MTHSRDCRTCGACCTVLEVHPYRSEMNKVNSALRAKRLPLLQPSSVESSTYLTPIRYGEKPRSIPRRHQRCVALEGTVGIRTTCTIYAARPYNCSGFEPGDLHCLLMRLAHGIDSPKVAPELLAYITRDNTRTYLEDTLTRVRECYAPGTRYLAQLQELHTAALAVYGKYAATRRTVQISASHAAVEVSCGQGN